MCNSIRRRFFFFKWNKEKKKKNFCQKKNPRFHRYVSMLFLSFVFLFTIDLRHIRRINRNKTHAQNKLRLSLFLCSFRQNRTFSFWSRIEVSISKSFETNIMERINDWYTYLLLVNVDHQLDESSLTVEVENHLPMPVMPDFPSRNRPENFKKINEKNGWAMTSTKWKYFYQILTFDSVEFL